MTPSGGRALLLAGAVLLAGIASTSVMVAPPPGAGASVPGQPESAAIAVEVEGYGLIVDPGGPRIAVVVGGDELPVFGGL